ncbi:putative motility protein [Sporosarcina sp. USHLN248]|uniref:putative motility protein n=1 Tax=Sporosarcina sp. USHLN248 TaxID=3081300 RepID=UPI003018DAD6
MELNAMMASQLRSLQSTVQMSVMNKALSMNANVVTDLLQGMDNQSVQAVVHPHKGQTVDLKA